MSETTEAVVVPEAPADLPPTVAAGIAANAAAGRAAQRGSGLRKGVVAVVALVLLFTVPFVANAYIVFVVSLTLVYAISTLGFNLLVGWSGQIGLAHAALFAVGAYSSSVAVAGGVPYLLTIPLAGLAAALLAVVIGFPAIRLRGFFLAIATLALGMAIVELLTFAQPVTGGGGGMNVQVFSLPGINDAASTYFIVLTVAAIMFFLVRRALVGRFGRTLQAVRDLGQLTGSLGVSALRYRLVRSGSPVSSRPSPARCTRSCRPSSSRRCSR